ncbi:MAG: 50S ribosomal protein L15e [Nitrososphaerota archaeon]|nr:50S ribosomal protein L15e [Nitrososphaerota archaeon]MDG6955766.1 50S ribosomal protein L15e [Nitrososphaerota archaeon]MDG6959162.1 50S ribosomal protein L15e [Nitrososphaerota archaeon]MDG6968799.1 50S ribosomal protein L15e [Nitrososphaerota archaeon]MDG6973560.1 50S ribosomal protein L15e [Nitrososphaerota archaeon]
MYSQISKTWQQIFHEKGGDMKTRAIELRRQPATLRVDRPWRLDRARALGYKAKEGVIVVRMRVSRGGMRKQRPTSGRRPKHMGVLKIKSAVSSQQVAERRVQERHPNMKVLGSYPVWHDGMHAWYECILIDPQHPAIRRDYDYRRALGIVG